MRDISRLNDHNVPVEFVSEMIAAGLEDFSVRDLIKLYDYAVKPETVREVIAGGLVDPTVKNLIEAERLK
jgi:hypothetical protein